MSNHKIKIQVFLIVIILITSCKTSTHLNCKTSDSRLKILEASFYEKNESLHLNVNIQNVSLEDIWYNIMFDTNGIKLINHAMNDTTISHSYISYDSYGWSFSSKDTMQVSHWILNEKLKNNGIYELQFALNEYRKFNLSCRVKIERFKL